jgi:hypothetical protein
MLSFSAVVIVIIEKMPYVAVSARDDSRDD